MGKALLVPGGPRLVGRAVGVSHRVLCRCIVLAKLVLDGPPLGGRGSRRAEGTLIRVPESVPGGPAWEGEAPAEPK